MWLLLRSIWRILFNQINNGNALALAFAKGFGWGAELNIRYIFEKAFTTDERGQGYPLDRAVPQQTNAAILSAVKSAVIKDNYLETLRAMDQELVKIAVSGERFKECLFNNGQDAEIEAYVKSLLS